MNDDNDTDDKKELKIELDMLRQKVERLEKEVEELKRQQRPYGF